MRAATAACLREPGLWALVGAFAVFLAAGPAFHRDTAPAPESNLLDVPVIAAEYEQYRRQSDLFDTTAAYCAASFAVGGAGAIERGMRISPEFLPILGVELALGRNFSAGETHSAERPAILIAHNVWVTRFAASPKALGRTLQVDGAPHVIVGILPPGFAFSPVPHLERAVLAPVSLAPAACPAGIHFLGRLRPGVDAETAARRLRAVSRRLFDRGRPPGIGLAVARTTPGGRAKPAG
jgi:hypothetical protein